MKGFSKDGTPRFSDGHPLTASMDNVLASRLGYAARQTAAGRAGDDIDRGLILLNLLNQYGFDVTERQ